MKERLIRFGVAFALLAAPVTGIACDREDQRDVEEVGREVEREVDRLDTDGKDD